MEENAKCYRFEKIININAFLEKSIDATYIIHLEGNGRLDNIRTQLLEYQPSNIVFIVFNKGYKKCNKTQEINQPAIDLIDSYLQIFKHAEKEQYQNILILEDDFIFDKKIKEQIHQDNINTFLNKHKNTQFVWYFGCIPLLQIPYDYNNNILIFSIGAHAVVYSKTYRESILNLEQSDIIDWDVLLFRSTFMNRYNYYIPLCYQLFPKTDNSKLWGIGFGETFSKIFVFLTYSIITIFKLDTQVDPGYPFFYMFSKILFYILLFTGVYILFRKSIFKLIKSRIKIK